GRKLVILDENGIHSYGPAEAEPTLDENTLNCLSTKFRGPLDPLVRRIAMRVYNKKKAQIDSDVLRDARKQVNEQFESNSARELCNANVRYQTDLRSVADKRGIFPQRIRVLSSDSQVGVRALLYDPTGKKRTFAPVPEIQGDPDVAVRVEESLLNNGAHTMFAGKKFTGEELDKEFTTILKPLLGEVKTTDQTDKPFSITFPNEKPIEVHFDKQTLTFTIRGKEFTSGDTEYDGMDTTAI